MRYYIEILKHDYIEIPVERTIIKRILTDLTKDQVAAFRKQAKKFMKAYDAVNDDSSYEITITDDGIEEATCDDLPRYLTALAEENNLTGG